MVSSTIASWPEATATFAAMNGTIARSGSSRPWVQWNSSRAISPAPSGLSGPRRDHAGRQAALLQVLLVVVLGLPERRRRCDFGGDRAAVALLLGVPRGLGGPLLLGRKVEDRRAVLGAHVRALAVHLGRVVVLPEDVQELLVGDLGGVELDLDRLGMAAAAAADLLVGRALGGPAGVPHGGGDYPGRHPERRLNPPEATPGKQRLLGPGRHGSSHLETRNPTPPLYPRRTTARNR